MALQTANQFQLTPDIGGAVSRGINTGLGIQQAQRQTQLSNQRAAEFEQGQQKLVLQGAANAAVKAQNLPTDEDRIAFFQKRIPELVANNRDPTDSQEVLDLLVSGQPEKANALLDSFVKTSVQTGLIERPPAPSTKLAELELKKGAQIIRKQEANLRKGEAEERVLDRKLKRETNDIKKQELEIKLDEKKREVEEGKRERKFNAENSIKSVDNSIGTIDRMLLGSKLESATGLQANFPTVAGTDASDFEADLDTLQSQAFLGEIEKMKGLGALSESEGKKLAQSIGALTIKQSDKKLRLELERIRSVYQKGKEKLSNKFKSILGGDKGGDISTMTLEQLKAERARLGGK